MISIKNIGEKIIETSINKHVHCEYVYATYLCIDVTGNDVNPYEYQNHANVFTNHFTEFSSTV
jgi:hypothetical protein